MEWKLPCRALICLIVVLLIFQFTATEYLVTESVEDQDITAGELAALQDDSLDSGRLKTIYDLSDYEADDVLVMYRDGSVELIRCETRDVLKEQLSLLENDPDVEAYQPNFSYTAGAVTTTQAEGDALPEFYGAPDEKEAMESQLQKRASVNISEGHPIFPADSGGAQL